MGSSSFSTIINIEFKFLESKKSDEINAQAPTSQQIESHISSLQKIATESSLLSDKKNDNVDDEEYSSSDLDVEVVIGESGALRDTNHKYFFIKRQEKNSGHAYY